MHALSYHQHCTNTSIFIFFKFIGPPTWPLFVLSAPGPDVSPGAVPAPGLGVSDLPHPAGESASRSEADLLLLLPPAAPPYIAGGRSEHPPMTSQPSDSGQPSRPRSELRGKLIELVICR